MFGLMHEKELWLCIFAAIVIKVVSHYLYPRIVETTHKVIFIIVAAILGISLQQYYAKHKHEFLTRAKDCSVWKKMYTFVETQGKFECPQQEMWELETRFHLQFILLDFLIAFVIDRFLFSFDKIASGFSGSYERLIDGVNADNWWSPAAWFRSIFFINLIKPIIVLTFMSIAFTIVWKVCLILVQLGKDKMRDTNSVRTKEPPNNRNTSSNRSAQSQTLFHWPTFDTTYFRSTFATFPFPYNLICNGILVFVTIVWDVFNRFRNYVVQLIEEAN